MHVSISKYMHRDPGWEMHSESFFEKKGMTCHNY